MAKTKAPELKDLQSAFTEPSSDPEFVGSRAKVEEEGNVVLVSKYPAYLVIIKPTRTTTSVINGEVMHETHLGKQIQFKKNKAIVPKELWDEVMARDRYDPVKKAIGKDLWEEGALFSHILKIGNRNARKIKKELEKRRAWYDSVDEADFNSMMDEYRPHRIGRVENK